MSLTPPDRTYAAYGRYPMKPRSMPEFRRRKHNENSLLAPSCPEFRRARSRMLWPSWSTTHEMFTDSRVFANRNRYFRLQSLSRCQFTLAPRGVSGLRPRPDRQPQGDCWGAGTSARRDLKPLEALCVLRLGQDHRFGPTGPCKSRRLGVFCSVAAQNSVDRQGYYL